MQPEKRIMAGRVTDPIGTKIGLMTWTYCNHGLCIVVTADNIALAKSMIADAFYVRKINGVEINNEDLIPLPTHHRHYRVINSLKEDT